MYSQDWEIAEAQKEIGETKMIIGNGAGSFAHFLSKYRTTEGFVSEESKIGMGWERHDAVKLNQLYLSNFFSKVLVFPFHLIINESGKR